MLYTDEIFRVLEIEPTEDKRSIKRAYAAMAKKFHPEENPQEWQRLHDAYEAALAYADREVASESQALYVQQTAHTTSEEENNIKYEERERKQSPILPEGDITSGTDEESREVRQFFELWQQEREESYREAYRTTLLRLKSLERDYIQPFEKWRELMVSPEMHLIWTETAVLEGIAKALSKKAIDNKTKHFLLKKIKEIQKITLENPSDDDSRNKLILLEQIQKLVMDAYLEMTDDFSKAGRMHYWKTFRKCILLSIVLTGLFLLILFVTP